MTEPPFQPRRESDEDAAIVRRIEPALGFALPEPTHAGVAANVRLLEQHMATLGSEAA